MYHIAINPDRSRSDLLVLREFLPIVKSLLKTHDLLKWLLSVDHFVYTLLLCVFLKQSSIIVDLLTFLGIICGTSEGEQQVLDAFDELMLFAQEKTRFQSVVALVSTVNDPEIVLNILVFFNNLIHNADSIVQRMAVALLLPPSHVDLHGFVVTRLRLLRDGPSRTLPRLLHRNHQSLHRLPHLPSQRPTGRHAQQRRHQRRRGHGAYVCRGGVSASDHPGAGAEGLQLGVSVFAAALAAGGAV